MCECALQNNVQTMPIRFTFYSKGQDITKHLQGKYQLTQATNNITYQPTYYTYSYMSQQKATEQI